MVRKRLVASLLFLTAVMSLAQTPAYPKAKLIKVVDGSEAVLRKYQALFKKGGDLPAVKNPPKKDREVIAVSGMSVILLHRDLSQKPSMVDPFSWIALFANMDSAAINASLTASALAFDASHSGNKRELEAAREFV